MSTYVMSDLHGCFEEFQQMLDLIKFNPEKDRLIIAGDIIDRGPDNYKMLKYAESKPESVQFILGNHDEDFKEYCEGIEYLYTSKRYKGRVTGILKCPFFSMTVRDQYSTVMDLLLDDPVTKTDFLNWKKMFESFPYYLKLRVNKKDYIVVHAGYITNSEFKQFHWQNPWSYLKTRETFNIWAREESLTYGGLADTTIVFGHTPTIFEDSKFFNNGKVWYNGRDDGCRFFNIDCGLVYGKAYPNEIKNANLACIRLEDEKIFYLYN